MNEQSPMIRTTLRQRACIDAVQQKSARHVTNSCCINVDSDTPVHGGGGAGVQPVNNVDDVPILHAHSRQCHARCVLIAIKELNARHDLEVTSRSRRRWCWWTEGGCRC